MKKFDNTRWTFFNKRLMRTDTPYYYFKRLSTEDVVDLQKRSRAASVLLHRKRRGDIQ
jgi:hypothetical protein